MKRFLYIIMLLNFLFPQGEGGENMEVIGYLEFGQDASDITGFYQDGREFAVVGLQNSAVFVDITDPSDPWEIDRIMGGNSIWRDLKYHDRHVYIGTEANDGIKVVSVDDPNNPILVNTITDFTNSHNIHINEGYLYVIGANNCNIWIYDLFIPSEPEFVGCWDGEYIHDIDVYNDKAYAMGIYSSTAYIIDVSDKSNPTTITSWSYSGMAHDAAVMENEQILLTADETSGGHIKIWDISDFSNINLLSEYQTNPNYSVHNIYTLGNFAVMSYYADGTRVLDISNPLNPIEIGYYDTSFEEGLYVGNWGTYIYLPSGIIISSDIESGSLFILSSPINYSPPILDYSPGEFYFDLSADEIQYNQITIVNIGDEESTLNYTVTAVPFSNNMDHFDNYGNFWADSENEENIEYVWIDISEIGLQYPFSHNDESGSIIEIGFTFSLYENSYDQCFINPNGWIGFESDNTAWDNSEIPSIDAPRPAIFGFWDDLNPINDNCNDYCSGEVLYHSNSERLVVWFNNVAHWWTDYENSFYDFQFVLYPDGRIDLNYNNIEGNYSATIGIQNLLGVDGLQINFDEDIVNNDHTIRIIPPLNWLIIDGVQNGELLYGESAEVTFSVSSENLDIGSYNAYLNLMSNGGTAFIPVEMDVEGGTDFELGDINFDGEINIVDIVLSINFIIDVEDPTADEFEAADINGDGSLDITDIVLLVNIILDS